VEVSLGLRVLDLLRVAGLGVSVRVTVGTPVRLGETLSEAVAENDMLLRVPLMVPTEGVTLQEDNDRVRNVSV